jgi:hypothetical protein
MKKAFPISLMIMGLVFLGAGFYTADRGLDAKDQVTRELHAQNIVTPEDATLPNVRVHDAASAAAMADIIGRHAEESTGGLTYAQMGRFMVASGDPAGTNNEAEAVVGADGKPVANPLRNVAFQASALRTSLFTSVMAFNIADLVVGLGALMAALGFAVGGVGVALGGLAIPALARRLHVSPVAANA